MTPRRRTAASAPEQPQTKHTKHDLERGDFRSWVECSRLLDRSLHRHVADLAVRHGIDLQLVPRRYGFWTHLYDLELRDGTREQWTAVMAYMRRLR